MGVNDLTDNATLAHLLKYDSILGRFPAEVTPHRRRDRGGRHEDRGHGRARPGQAPVGRPRRRHRHRVDRATSPTPLRPAPTSTAAPRKVIISAPAKNEDVTIVMGVNEGVYDPADAHDHLQRLLHHQLPRADGQGPARDLRHRARPDDDHPRVHQRPGHPRLPAQGPAPRPGGRAEHDPDHDRRGQGDRPGHARAEGQARRLRRCACRCRPARRPTSPSSSPGAASKDEINAAFKAAAEGALEGLPRVHRGPDRLLGHRDQPRLVHLRLRPDQRDRPTPPRSSAGTTTSGATPTGWSTSSSYVGATL